MLVRVEINSIGRWETARHPETDEPMVDVETDELPSEAELIRIKTHNSVNRRRIRVVVDGVPVVENRPGTKFFNLGTEEGNVQLPHGAPSPPAFEPAPEPAAAEAETMLPPAFPPPAPEPPPVEEAPPVEEGPPDLIVTAPLS